MSDVTRPPGTTSTGQPIPDARGETAVGTAPAAAAPRPAAPSGTASTRLLPHEECDRLGQRLHHAVSGFVDDPRAAVEEADRALEEIVARLTDAAGRRRHALRASWQGTDGHAAPTDTEQLRLALRDYRELADRLLRL
ncbi:hypothetical protein SUDANB58_01619 [Streptomyces sp. enrichment culture]|uniref:hypothetical protein n=1 Tax=Streptomyces sp. enrichment culture TaxID=1795815 RepID=UPI003F547061